MVYIVIFGLFIIGTIAFITWAFKEVLSLDFESKEKAFFRGTIPIIERPYRAIDLRSRIDYMDSDYAMRNHFYEGRTIIHDARHKQHLIENACFQLTKTMLSDGLIEIRDTKTDPNYYGNPYHNSIEMRVKVYKPEN